MSDIKFKSYLEDIDPKTRSCLLFLNEEIKKIRVEKTKIPIEIENRFKSISSDMDILIDSNNKCVATNEALKEHYERLDRNDIIRSILSVIVKDLDKHLKSNREQLNENIDQINISLKDIEKVKDDVIDIINEFYKRMSIEAKVRKLKDEMT